MPKQENNTKTSLGYTTSCVSRVAILDHNNKKCTMKKYKVEITKTYCIDVYAEEEEVATQLAERELEDLEARDMQHYNQTGDTEFMVYDVTYTEDPFHPLNENNEIEL